MSVNLPISANLCPNALRWQIVSCLTLSAVCDQCIQHKVFRSITTGMDLRRWKAGRRQEPPFTLPFPRQLPVIPLISVLLPSSLWALPRVIYQLTVALNDDLKRKLCASPPLSNDHRKMNCQSCTITCHKIWPVMYWSIHPGLCPSQYSIVKSINLLHGMDFTMHMYREVVSTEDNRNKDPGNREETAKSVWWLANGHTQQVKFGLLSAFLCQCSI